MLLKPLVMSNAGKNLKYLRKLRGWTQEEFAQKLSIKRSLVGAYEEERAEPRLEVMEAISNLFKISLEDFLFKDLSEKSGGSYLEKRRNSKLISGVLQKFGWFRLRPLQVIWRDMAIRNLLMS